VVAAPPGVVKPAIVVVLGEAQGARHRRVPQREVGVDGGRRATVPERRTAQHARSIPSVDPPLCPTCGQPASEALGGPEHEWECRNEACSEFGQSVAVDEPHGAERDRRLAFAIPPIDRPPEDLVLKLLDRADEDDRLLLLKAAHPELDTGEETVVIGGEEMNPRLHLVMHEIVAKQLADLDPPEVWETAQRLRRLGYRQHEILHMLGAAMSGEIWRAMHDQREYDREAHIAALAGLPESWERQRPGGPAPPASRAAHADEAKRRRKAHRAARRANRRR
jgi:uncharacterized protein DUF1841